ncbi:HD domain-containing protein [Campylobacter pinnipediorum]|uniref:HD domain-containing protein n=1 Tax=Campylobacter pinnipediorum TaxID=1965231 RepID=UPI000A739670|nr:HD domain-containing protein [Campylobacter pinnipediorum]
MKDIDKFYKFFNKNSRNFINFLIKERDDRFKNIFLETLQDFFGDFCPDIDKLPISIIAANKYAQNLISVNSKLDILIVYKDIQGYNTKHLLRSLDEKFQEFGINIKIVELSSLYDKFKDDIKSKSKLCLIRYICGSKTLYKNTRDEITRLKEYNKDSFLSYHIKKLLPFDSVPFLEQEPNLKTSFGGVDDIYSLNCILSTISGENTARVPSVLLLDEKQTSQFNICVDFLLSLKSTLNLVNNEDIFSEKNIDETTKLMQTKSKKSQDTNTRISQKILSCMKNIGLFTRFVASSITNYNFSNFSFLQKKLSKTKGGFYNLNSTLFVHRHKKIVGLKDLLDDFILVDDIDYKIDMSVIFYIKKVVSADKGTENINTQIKKLLAKNNSHCILKAFLDAGVLNVLMKPMENIALLPKYDGYHKFSVDEHSMFTLYFLENIKDKFINSLYGDICLQGKIMLKLVALMHDVGKGSEGEHEVVGANIFRAYANKLELIAEAVNMGVLLIKYHTLMNVVANTEDIYSQRVVFGFISKLSDKKSLMLLYVLTYCIVNATDDSLYTPYLSKLLRKLYDLSFESFDDENLLDEATRRAKKEHSIKRHDEFAVLDEKIQNKIFEIYSNLLFAKHSVLDIIDITKKAFLCDDIDFDLQNTQGLRVKIISNRFLNLSALLAVFADFDLAYMEIFELFDEKFFIRLEFNKNIKNSDLLNFKVKALNALNSNEKLVLTAPIIYKDEISFDLNHSDEYAKLNINAKDQRGLMAYVMSVFYDMSFKITSAKVQTIKNKTRNLFLISKDDELNANYEKILNLLISE